MTGVSIHLEPYELKVIMVTDESENMDDLVSENKTFDASQEEVNGPWKVSFAQNEDYPHFTGEIVLDDLHNILRENPKFSGIIRYENTFVSDGKDSELILENAYESAEVWCNSKYAGIRFCPPYKYDLSDLLKDGTNTIRIEVRTTLERKVYYLPGNKGFFNAEEVISPEGIIGKVLLNH
jgi:hypothetical protein